MLNIFSIETIGIIATLIGLISFLPVVRVVYKSRKTNNFPYSTLYLAIISNILWIIYGLNEPALSSAFSGVVYSLIYSYILYIKFLY